MLYDKLNVNIYYQGDGMMLKKILSVLTAAVIVLCCLPLSAVAFSDENIIKTTESFSPEYRLGAPDCTESEDILSNIVDFEELKNYLLENISKANSDIDISRFSIPTSAADALNNILFYGIPEVFNVYKIGYSYVSTKLLSVHLSFVDFADTEAEYKECFDAMKASADKLLDGIENNPSLSDAEKALLLHDRLCVLNEYAYSDVAFAEHTAYGALVNRSSVCQGYTMAYMYLLNRVGIKNYYCSSDALNHAWNIVYIDEIPYHVDVTWDDYAWRQGGRGAVGAVKHDNFLRSTKGIISTNHNATDFDSSPVDTRYDNYYWQNSDTEFQLVGNKIYYIDNKNERLMCADDNTVLKNISDVWSAGGKAFWVGNFARLSSAGGELFYSLSGGVYKYTLKTGASTKIFTPPSMASGYSVFGFTYEDGYLVCDINNAPPYGDISGLYQVKQKYDDISHIMTKITVNTLPEKTQYYIGDKFDADGLSIKAVYSDGNNDVITEDFSCSGFASDTAGEKTIIVTHGGFSTEFKVNVKTPEIKLSSKTLEMTEREVCELKAVCSPAEQEILWKASSDNVSVDGGNITAIKKGKSTVTAEFTYNGKKYKAVCDIVVLCGHFNAEAHPEIPPTVDNVGYTEGLFCESCDEYISGHIEIPKLELVFKDSEHIKSDGKNILMLAGETVKELILQAPDASYVVDKNGKTVAEGTFAGTGMTLVFSDGTRYEIAVFGDVDGGGNINAADARLALRASVGLEKYSSSSVYYKAANVESADKLSASDARLILRASVGLENAEEWMK